MVNINWDEFKIYKKESNKDDNFMILLDFIKSYYNMTSPAGVFDLLREDATAELMLAKRDIVDAEGLEKYMYNI